MSAGYMVKQSFTCTGESSILHVKPAVCKYFDLKEYGLKAIVFILFADDILFFF